MRLKPLWVGLYKHHSPWHCFPNAAPVTVGSYHQLKASLLCRQSILWCIGPTHLHLPHQVLGLVWTQVLMCHSSSVQVWLQKPTLRLARGIKWPSAKRPAELVHSSKRGYGWVRVVRDGTRSTGAAACPGQTPQLHRAGRQRGGWGRYDAGGMLGTMSLSPSMLDQSPSEGHSAEMLCYCLPQKESKPVRGSLVPTSPIPLSLPLFSSFALAAVLLLESWLAPSSGNYTLSSGI